ncbi:MAG: tandem-95 repeat protein, partial [Kofleriaceae bacterium]
HIEVERNPYYWNAANVTYTISDGHGGTATATVSVTVTAVNDVPVAIGDSKTTLEDTALGFAASTLTSNDSDADGDALTVTSVAATATTHGTVALAGVTVTYTPDANYNGAADFTYTISDGHGGTASAQVAVTITAVNDAPVATGDAATTPEDTALVLAATTLTGNDSDADGDGLTVTSVATTATTHGTVVLASGSITYTPTANYNGAADFTYTISDGHAGTASATVSVTVTSVNDAPVVTASSATLAYLENASAVKADAAIVITDGDSATLVGATVRLSTGCASPQDVLALAAPPSGITVTGYAAATCTLTLTGAASPASYQAALRLVTYANTSDAPATAARVLRFTVDDGAAASNTGSDDRDLTLTAVDDPAVAVDDTATVVEDAPATAIAVLANDTDVDAGPKLIGSVTQPANGTVLITGGGTGLTYAPHSNTCNNPPGTAPDTFTYTLLPGGSTATVTISVTCVDDPPVAVDDHETVAEDSGVTTFSVLANDTDLDGGARFVASITQPAHGIAAVGPLGSSVTYTPTPSYCNQAPNTPPDTFTYTLSPGGSSATVAVTVPCACGKHKPTDFVVGSN